MEEFTAAIALASAAVLVITELAKLIPIAFTSKYPAWVNGILSVIATLVVSGFTFTFVGIGDFITKVLLVAVTAAVAYNQWTSHLKAKA